MVKFLKQNKAVIMLQGRYAGRKAVIVRNFDDWTRDRPYGHCLVAGLKKYPSKVIRKDSAKKSRVKCFIKLVNYQHLMPTRYTLDVDLKDIVTPDALQSKDAKVIAAKETKKKLEERFKTGKNRSFFTSSGSEFSILNFLVESSCYLLLLGLLSMTFGFEFEPLRFCTDVTFWIIFSRLSFFCCYASYFDFGWDSVTFFSLFWMFYDLPIE